MNKTIIKVNNLYKKYNNIEVLSGINLEVKQGDFIFITGKSGSGKSSLLYIISGIEQFDKGDILLFNQNIKHLNSSKMAKIRSLNIGFIFQSYKLISNLSIVDNVMLPLFYINGDLKLSKKKALELLKKVGIFNKLNSSPDILSGGEQQRVAVCRALINNPSLILADEPTGNLDHENTNYIFNILKQLNYENKTSVLFITHSLSLCKRYGKHFSIKNKVLV